jgi:hypothetical protein
VSTVRSFVLLRSLPLYDRPQFVIHSPVNGREGHFQGGAITNEGAMNTCIRVDLRRLSFLSGKCLAVEGLIAVPFYSPTNST